MILDATSGDCNNLGVDHTDDFEVYGRFVINSFCIDRKYYMKDSI